MSGEHKVTLGEVIRLARKRKMLTQAEAADHIGVARRTWVRWENGKALPRVHEFERLVVLLSLSPEEIAVFAAARSVS